MPTTPRSICNEPGCNELTETRYCNQHSKENIQKQTRKQHDLRRGSPSARGYDANWRKIRVIVLSESPLCVDPHKLGCQEPATEVDHVYPIRLGGGNERTNLQSLCKRCHARKTATEDSRFLTWNKK